MARQQTFFRSPKSIAGAVLAGLGTFILYENLASATSQLSHLLGATSREALGTLPTAVLAASQVLHAYAPDRHQFIEEFFQQVLLVFWPLLPVIVGAVLSRDASMDKPKARRERKSFHKKATAPISRHSVSSAHRLHLPQPSFQETPLAFVARQGERAPITCCGLR